ncbi:hypothetical protein [Spirosoma panaciterrae]|uniref:hypothetical protein n=1 Tax=Spirosoma panaciterrae TaxID=496058 RepID=UPI000375040C|nr:hypothetical protein [Spirosoma panaciterrae]
MEKSTRFLDITFKLVVLAMLLLITLYQVSIDRKLTNLDRKAQQAAAAATQAETSAEQVRTEVEEIADRLGI